MQCDCRWIAILILVCLVPVTGFAQAPVEDHLKCYWVNDPLIFKDEGESWLQLYTSQFGEGNCRIVGKGVRLYCVPASKIVSGAVEAKLEKGAFESLEVIPIEGAATSGKVCYQIQCDEVLPEPPNPSVEVTDQFSTRDVEKLKPYLLCGPTETQGPGPGDCTSAAECGSCEVCDGGECIPAVAGTDPKADCEDDGAASCGQDGQCDGAGACRLYAAGIECAGPSCSGSSVIPGASCDGAGTCVEAAPIDCGAYVCDESSASCQECVANQDCAIGNVCIANTCVSEP